MQGGEVDASCVSSLSEQSVVPSVPEQAAQVPENDVRNSIPVLSDVLKYLMQLGTWIER